jgi:hypothetical protein
MGTMRSRLKSSNVLARVQRALSYSHRRYWLPQPDNRFGVPTAVMRDLQAARLPTPDKDIYSKKLGELMRVIEINGG